jgi:hypothetical protein
MPNLGAKRSPHCAPETLASRRAVRSLRPVTACSLSGQRICNRGRRCRLAAGRQQGQPRADRSLDPENLGLSSRRRSSPWQTIQAR